MSINITTDLVGHVAKLGMLKIDAGEIGNYQSHLEFFFNNVANLESVNTEGVKPFANPMREYLDLFASHNDRRDDSIHSSLAVEDVLKNAPEQKHNQFKIEVVINEGE